MDGPDFASRRSSVSVEVGDVVVGGGRPIVVQSMTNTDTADADATAIQVAQLAHAGSELVRITVNNEAAAAAVPVIVQKVRGLGADVPISRLPRGYEAVLGKWFGGYNQERPHQALENATPADWYRRAHEYGGQPATWDALRGQGQRPSHPEQTMRSEEPLGELDEF